MTPSRPILASAVFGVCGERQSCRWEVHQGRQGFRLPKVAFLETCSPIPLLGTAEVSTAWELEDHPCLGTQLCSMEFVDQSLAPPEGCELLSASSSLGTAGAVAPLVVLEDHRLPSFFFFFFWMDETMCLILSCGTISGRLPNVNGVNACWKTGRWMDVSDVTGAKDSKESLPGVACFMQRKQRRVPWGGCKRDRMRYEARLIASEPSAAPSGQGRELSSDVPALQEGALR